MLKVGDYITTYSGGYFRVEHVLERYAQETANGFVKGEKMPNVVVSKQVFNQSFEFTLGYDRSDESDCKLVPKKAQTVIDEFFIDNPKKLLELNQYEIPNIKKNKNIILTLDQVEHERLTVLLYSMKHKFSLRELKDAFVENGLEKCIGNKGKNTYMLCIVNINYEVNGKKEEVYVFDKIKKMGSK